MLNDEIEIDEDDLEENEVLFFKCKDCGSRTLNVTDLVTVMETIESVLPCECGNEDQAAYRTEQTTTQWEETGYVTQDRHIHVEEREKIDELDREEDDEVTCEKCYKKYKDRSHLWDTTESSSEEDADFDLTITCGGCDREIEFGYSHPNKQGRIFLGEDDTDFNPWKTFPDPKYVDKWRQRNWLSPTKPKRS